MSDLLPDPQNEPRRTVTQRWLARLSFSFIIIAAYLVWQAFHVRGQASGLSPLTRQVLYLIAAAMSIAMGMLGIRERHRRD